MRKAINWLKKYFIPHEDNDHRPHFLRVEAALGILSFILFIEGIFLIQTFIVLPFSDFFAAIVPQALVDLSNQNRQENALAALRVNLFLQNAAQMKAEDMAAKGYFSHNSPAGDTPWDWIEKAGYKFNYAGENLAVNFFDSSDAVKAWMASPGHRANILSKNYTEIGVGWALGRYEGREAVFIVQMFGAPAAASAGSAAPLVAQPFLPAAQPPVAGATAPKPQKPVAPPAPPTGGNNEKPVTKPAPVAKKDTEIVSEKSNISTSSPQTLAADLENNVLPPQSHLVQTAKVLQPLSTPHKSVNFLYLVLATIIFLAIVLKIFIKISVQHHALVVNGVALLIIIASALAVNNYLVTARAAVF